MVVAQVATHSISAADARYRINEYESYENWMYIITMPEISLPL